MAHPLYRPRRLRESPLIRRMVRETRLGVENLILPLFAVHGRGVREPIGSMPGVSRLSLDELLKEAKDAASMGIPAILLFGVPQSKDPRGSEAYAEDGIVQQVARAVKETIPDLLVITDVCLCQYTSHGHCGIVEDGRVKNDASVELLARVALSHVESGADVVAPSDMMDGRVGAIREALDEAGYTETPIMAYSAKYASAFYGPFREAAESAPQFGDRRSYQMDPANAAEAMREVGLDVDEGADIVMVKPALPYLDVIARVRQEFGLPARGVLGLGGVRDDQGGRAPRLARRGALHARGAHGDPAGRRRSGHHLLRPRGGAAARAPAVRELALAEPDMLAVVKDPAKRGIVLEDVPVPTVGPWEVLVRVRAAGICGSDQRIYNEVNPARRRRFIIGHEIAGEVVAVGERMTEVRLGTPRRRRDLHRLRHLPALQGRPGQPLREAGGARRHGRRRDDGVRGGPRAERPPRCRPGLAFEAAVLADPLACVIRGLEMITVTSGSWVAVLGPGQMGLFATQVIKRILRARVVVIGTRDDRLALAREHGGRRGRQRPRAGRRWRRSGS